MDERKSDLLDRLAVVGKAFGSAKRLEIVDLLAQGERAVEDLAQAAGMGLSTVSAHLQVLKASNLVTTRRVGTRIFYRLAGDDVLALYDGIRQVAVARSADVARALDAYLNVPGDAAVGVVSRAELAEVLDDPRVAVLDVRPEAEYRAGHIPGAEHAPLEVLTALAPQLADRRVIAYCRGSFCVMAHDAVRVLSQVGVSAERLEDGMLEWRTHGGDVELEPA